MLFAALLGFSLLNTASLIIQAPETFDKPCPVTVYEVHAECTVIDSVVDCEYTDLKTDEKSYTVCADGTCVDYTISH